MILLVLKMNFDIEKIYNESPTLQKTVKVLLCNHVIDIDWETYEVVFNIELFENKNFNNSDSWSWIENEYIPLFTRVRSDAGGTLTSSMNRMKKFFSENPDVRKEDILQAVQLYLKTINDPQYLQRADYFIKKGVGVNATSRLEEFVKIVKSKEEDENNTHRMI